MKKRILIGVGIALLSILVLGGAVFAVGFQFWTGTANVSVVESMTVAAIAQTGGGTWVDPTWTVSMKPGEVKTLTLRVTNTGTVPLTITPTIAGVVAGLTPSFTPGGPIPGGTFYDFVCTMTASGSVTPGGPYGFTIGFTRE